MKKYPFVRNQKIKFTSVVAVVTFLISSCEVYHFEKPQPSDVENGYIVPKAFRGEWTDDDLETTVTLGVSTIRIIGFDSMKVINRISTAGDSLWGRKYMKSLRFNPDTHRRDTILNYIIKGNKIYEIRKDGLSSGFPFVLRKDTVYFKKEIILDFELNQHALLRKLNERQYILNIHEENLWPLLEGRVGPWWQVILLEMNEDGKLDFRDMDESVKQHASLIYSSGSDFFFDVSWRKTEMLQLVGQGIFGKGKGLHRVNNSKGKKK